MNARIEITDLTTRARTVKTVENAPDYPPPAEDICTAVLWVYDDGSLYVCKANSVSPVPAHKDCPTCGAPHHAEQDCFECGFWNNVAKDPDVFVIGGNAYCAGPENALHKGMGGTKYRVRSLHKANVELTTTNLWHRGKVPPSHQNLLPNNAYFA